MEEINKIQLGKANEEIVAEVNENFRLLKEQADSNESNISNLYINKSTYKGFYKTNFYKDGDLYAVYVEFPEEINGKTVAHIPVAILRDDFYEPGTGRILLASSGCYEVCCHWETAGISYDGRVKIRGIIIYSDEPFNGAVQII